MLRFSNVSMRRGSRLLFEAASFCIAHGQKAGITGANGVGKSSLLAIVAGQLDHDIGEVELPSDWVIAEVSQESPITEKPAIEYVIDGDSEYRQLQFELEQSKVDQNGVKQADLLGRLDEIQGYSKKSRAAKLMAGLGFDASHENWPVTKFSGGWRVRLNLAQALMCRSDLLLLDEPTNHLDLDAVIWVQEWLSRYPGALLLISHDRDFLDSVVNQILHIEQRKLTTFIGNYSAFETVYAERLAQHKALYKKQQREVAHIRKFVDRFRSKATKARQVQSRLKTLDKLEAVAKAHVNSPFAFKFRPSEKLPSPLLTLCEAKAAYGKTEILNSVNLSIMPGDRIGLIGRNGAGKSTLIKLLAGELQLSAGDRITSDGCQIGYFAQHQLEQLNQFETPLQRLRIIDHKGTEADLRSYLGGFGFSGDRVNQKIATFSGGEKSRLVLAIIIYQRPNLLLLDEPTNHLDLEMRHALSVALQDFDGALLVVSHDRHLLRITVDQFLLVDSGKLSEFAGDLDDYRNWLCIRGESHAGGCRETTVRISSKDRRRIEAERRETLRPFRTILEQAEKKVGRLNQEKERLETLLKDPMLYDSDEKEKLTSLLVAKAGITKKVEQAETDWIAANDALEEAERSINENSCSKLI